MNQLDAIELSKNVSERITNFVTDDSFVRDEKLTKICKDIWGGIPSEGGLISDLWVEGAFPAMSADNDKGGTTFSLDDLVRTNHFNNKLRDQLHQTNAVPSTRPLYLHQRDAILESQKLTAKKGRPALIITAGTGAGKTESFLLPLLNDLYSTTPQSHQGVECIILYPMNALVNDQVDRLYEWLKNEEGNTVCTLFHMTSETPEDHKQANNDSYPKFESCRIRTRKQARGLENIDGKVIDLQERSAPPRILITNYSMLEYMLCRPQDAPFFGSNLRTIVLDEAHLYTGTLAAEMTLLLRRLAARCGKQSDEILQIATSATIGGGSESLKEFVTKLFTKNSENVRVIEGKPDHLTFSEFKAPVIEPTAQSISNSTGLDQQTLVYNNGTLELKKDEQLCLNLFPILRILVSEDSIDEAFENSNSEPARFLFRALKSSPIIAKLENILWVEKRLSLTELATQLFGNKDEQSRKATTRLLQLGAAARESLTTFPIVPHRIHLLARTTSGFSVCINPDCNCNSNRKLGGLGGVLEGIREQCPHCQSATLLLLRCDHCGEWALGGVSDGQSVRLCHDRWQDGKMPPKLEIYSLTESSKAVAMCLDTEGSISDKGIRVWKSKICANCHEDDKWDHFITFDSYTLSTLAESVLSEMPHYPSMNNSWLPSCGRRLLTFSDSRQEAARLGPRLTNSHELQVFRAALSRELENSNVDKDQVIYIENELLKDLKQLDDLDLAPSVRSLIERKVQESKTLLNQVKSGKTIKDWCEKLNSSVILKQLMGSNFCDKDQPENWYTKTQLQWDENSKECRSNLIKRVKQELARPARKRNSLETLGLAEIVYPGLESLSPPEELMQFIFLTKSLEGLRKNWTALIAMLCDDLRSKGCISLGSESEDEEYEFGAYLVGNWCSMDKSNIYTGLQPFVGATPRQQRRKFIASILQEKCFMSPTESEIAAKKVLETAFHQLLAEAGWNSKLNQSTGKALMWIERSEQQLLVEEGGGTINAIRLRLNEMALRNPEQLFECSTTYQIWTRHLAGSAHEPGCTNLVEMSKQKANESPRYGRLRSELLTSPVFEQGLWAVEHSAQLNPKENRRRQDLFKAGARNILSSTTTLELGIDIGGLSGVLMGNIPPGKANYLQRAGRAGRRADGSSIVVTFVRSRPFDREVFQQFGKYLGTELRQPTIDLDRERIGRRHFHAWLLNEFFRLVYPPNTHVGAMRAFGNMGQFCGMVLPLKWNGPQKPQLPIFESDWSKPEDAVWWVETQGAGLDQQFISYLKWLKKNNSQAESSAEQLFSDTGFFKKSSNWDQLITETEEYFKRSVGEWRLDFNSLLQTWNEIPAKNDDQKKANFIYYQLRTLSEITVIEALGDKQFLPRYGFPIGVLKLKVIVPDENIKGKIREEDQFRLGRPGLLALREYVPGSQLLVGGKLITSQGLMKHWTGAVTDDAFGLSGLKTECKKGHHYYTGSGKLGKCPICNSESGGSSEKLLFPKHGFTSAASQPPSRSTEVEKIGSAEQATITFHENGKIREPFRTNVADIEGMNAYYSEDGEILVFNSGENMNGFAICTSCGYTNSERAKNKGTGYPSGFENHTPLHISNKKIKCWGKTNNPSSLRNQMLSARETTDVLMVDISDKYGFRSFAEDRPLMLTLARALQASGAKLLGIDEREIGVMIIPTGEGGSCWGATLYDNVPGGAGHVLEMLKLGREWFDEAKELMFVSEEHHQLCNTACLDCLLNFSAQFDSSLLKRREAVSLLDKLLGDTISEDKDEIQLNNDESVTETKKTKPHLAKRQLARKNRDILS